MPYGLPQANSLDDIFSANPGAFFQAQQMVDGGMRQNEADLQRTNLANMFDQQSMPSRLQALGLENEFKQARIPGVQAESQMLGMNAKKQGALLDDSIASARRKFAEEASDSDLKMLENQAQKWAYSQDPAERAKGTELLMHHKEILRDRSKQVSQEERMLAQIRAKGEEDRKTQGQAIASGKYRPSGGAGGGPKDIWSAMANGKMGFEKGAMALYAQAQQAYQAGDAEAGESLMQMANQANNMYIQGRQAGAKAAQDGKVDLSASGIETRVAPPVQQFQAPGTAAPPAPAAAVPNDPKQMSTQQLSQMYPGVPPEKLKAAFKKKFGIDIK